jgi:hypothetical protein
VYFCLNNNKKEKKQKLYNILKLIIFFLVKAEGVCQTRGCFIILPNSFPLLFTSIFNKPSAMTSLIVLILVLYAASQTIPAVSSTTAYPSVPGTETTDCSVSGTDELIPVRREVYDGGRIIDISHRYTPDMPSFDSSDGIGQFLWLPKSMKNGSLANQSEIKLPAHTGTHVDAPGHFFDHYFDAGFDVDTLDLGVLNGSYQ